MDGKLVAIDKIKWVGPACSADRALLAAFSGPNQHVQQIQTAAPAASGHRGETAVANIAKLYQSNDDLAMYFVATGPGYDMQVADLFLWQVRESAVVAVYYEPGSVEQARPLGLTAVLASAVEDMLAKLCDEGA